MRSACIFLRKVKWYGSYLSPEMKSTGEAIGYDKKLHRAMYKAMIASGIRVAELWNSHCDACR